MQLKKKPAFTLIEVFIALLIFGCVVSALYFGTSFMREKTLVNRPSNYTWQQFLHTIETTEYPFYWVKTLNAETELRVWRVSKDSGDGDAKVKEYILKNTKNSHTLHLTGSNGGFMPLVYGVETIKFKPVGRRIKVIIKFESGDIREANLGITQKKVPND
ncbi:hypothetical protein EQG49_02210 [Periweissella cryptocerci]|uniref:Prepilin-type N-terminal cleavage/methylation domain-containing protein n=1 Tax=Periweissella cryptocerci TaxID=2506420 RepID=A0A4P6YRV1_9LACO|nr:hypothetical protein [Periweissella cryptocerci]QBO35361.1 hypothetical protein EQG49_02210 [Periweissella cryptocerci]